MSRPEIALSAPEFDALRSDRGAVTGLAARIAEALATPPYYVVLTGLPPMEERALTVALARGIAEELPTKPGMSEERRGKVSFTRVRINPERSAQGGSSTAYSRTNQPLALHTDSSYMDDPHEVVAFQMVQADDQGGETLMMSLDTILAGLDAETRAALAEPIFPFNRIALPILWERGGTRIRYYRAQIDTAVEAGAVLSPRAEAAMA
ncbi:MAG: TauD/TfdA family dioxygenase, partial [Pseudomonadota bacterium]